MENKENIKTDEKLYTESEVRALYITKKFASQVLYDQHKRNFIISMAAIFFSMFASLGSICGVKTGIGAVVFIIINMSIVGMIDLRKMRYYENKYGLSRGPLIPSYKNKSEQKNE